MSVEAWAVIENGVIVDCNPAMERLMGCARKDLLGISPTRLSPELQPCGGRSEDLVVSRIQEAFAKGHIRFEWQHQRLDGQMLPVLATVIPAKIGGRDALIVFWQDYRDTVAMRETQAKAREAEQHAAAEQAEVVSHGRHDKVRIVKFRRRKHYRKQAGHRQYYTELKITAISA